MSRTEVPMYGVLLVKSACADGHGDLDMTLSIMIGYLASDNGFSLVKRSGS